VTRADAYLELFPSQRGQHDRPPSHDYQERFAGRDDARESLIALAPLSASAQQMADGLTVQVAPPILPIYAQPPLPTDGYVWIPGFWHWSQVAGYYWVPGTWVLPPSPDQLWTPPYWAWADGAYLFHAGYWGAQVGYYGGVNYGYGYFGSGYQGGRWEGKEFVYNRAVTNVGKINVAHVYQQKVAGTNNARTSYAGGTGGLRSEPTAEERSAEHDAHAPATAEQTKHIAAAAGSPALAASRNKGRPAVAATSHPAQFKGPGVVHAQPAAVQHAAARPPAAAQHPTPVHAAAPHPAPAHAAAAPHPAAPAHAAAAPRPAAHPQTAAAAHPAPARAPAEEKGKEEKR